MNNHITFGHQSQKKKKENPKKIQPANCLVPSVSLKKGADTKYTWKKKRSLSDYSLLAFVINNLNKCLAFDL